MIAGTLTLSKQPGISNPVNYFIRWYHLQKIRLRANKYRFKEDKGGIKYLIESLRSGDTVFDIGAHKGGYLYFLQKITGKNGSVHAFEPQSYLFQYLTKLKTILHWQNVMVHPMAVSSSTGEAVLSIPYNKKQKTSPCATIIESATSFQFRSTEKVETITLDEYCMQRGLKPYLLKIDVEGNELCVFKGSEYILKNYHPKLLFECESRFVGEAKVLETFAYLNGLGYTGYYIENEKRKPIDSFHFGLQEIKSNKPYCNNFIFE